MEERKAIREFARRAAKDPKLRGLVEAMVKNGPPDMDSEEALVVVCVVWGTHLIDDCVEAECSYCGVPVSLAPSSQKMVDEYKGPVTFACLKCAQEGKPQEASGPVQ
jgi:hypothetical protein